MLESAFQKTVLLKYCSCPDTRLFRNSVGVGKIGNRTIRFGLFKGSADLIGWRTITITPDMVGSRVAVFMSVETKSKAGILTTEQENWLVQVRQAGGFAIIEKEK